MASLGSIFYIFLGSTQKISVKAEAVADALAHSKWYNSSSLDDKKMVLMVIARSQKRPKLSAYGLIDINIRTLFTVSTTSKFPYRSTILLVLGFEICIFNVLIVKVYEVKQCVLLVTFRKSKVLTCLN